MTQLHALALTVGIEVAVAAGLLLALERRSNVVRMLGLVAAASLLTHPLAWQANEAWLRALAFWPRATIIELSVIAAEALIVRFGSGWVRDEPTPWRAAWGLSAACNAASFGYGVVRYYWLLP